jgi:hypothetical protein
MHQPDSCQHGSNLPLKNGRYLEKNPAREVQYLAGNSCDFGRDEKIYILAKIPFEY